jgi:hypothetical protein
MSVAEENTQLDVDAVEHPGEDGGDDFVEQQNEAYLRYKHSGLNDQGYIDPSRDQEPDIAPEYGVSPHPDLFNPAPPENAEGSKPSNSEQVLSFEEKTERGEEKAEEIQEALDEAAEASAEAREDDEDETFVEKRAEEGQFAGLVEDESPKSRNTQ